MTEADIPLHNPDLPIEDRVDDLVSRITLEEKAGQMLHDAPAIERLGIPAYNWWNECLHGVALAGVATVFPQAIGLAAAFDAGLMSRIAVTISDEARAKHHEGVRTGDRSRFKGLTFWSPNINIFRDPRWGRGQETYGECPYLTGRLGVAFCRGLQGDDPKYLKLVATPKHYAVHSGPESIRHSFDAVVSEKDLRETYLPAFRDCIKEARAHSIMGAYNRTNGEPCCASPTLAEKILRGEWGFKGYIVSDCWAVRDFHENHKITKTPEESAALAVRHGTDLNCGCTYPNLPEAVRQGLVTEAELDVCLRRLFAARIRLGMFDPPDRVPYAQIPYEVNACEEHRVLALEAARASMVLLKNDGLLPLGKGLGTIAVIGPNADAPDALRGNYSGTPPSAVTPLEGIRKALPNATVVHVEGCHLTGDEAAIDEAVLAASGADVVVLALGISADVEGEEGEAKQSEANGDRTHIGLPGRQQELLERIVAVGKPVALVLLSGSPLAVPWAHEHVGAILQAWYPGQEGGTAIAEVLFGDINPAGRLPVTIPRSLDDVPPFTDYEMKNRTYRYLESEPLYPFGFGLSYTRFQYSDLRAADEVPVEVTAHVKNAGPAAGEEVVQLYVSRPYAPVRVPKFDLRGFKRIYLPAGAERDVTFTLTPRDLSHITESGKRALAPGRYRIYVGGSQPDPRSAELTGTKPLSTEINVTTSADLEY